MSLYLNLEILNREFHSKLLIAMESASRGMDVYLGRLKPYIMKDFFTPGIILDKSITPSPARLKEMEYCKKKKFIYTSLDEEAGLVNKDDRYVKERYSNDSLKLADKVFCWGKWDYNNLSRKYNNYKKKLIVSGNPRIDFWRKDFDFFYKKRKFQYSNYILFSLNFLMISESKFNEIHKILQKNKYVERGVTIKQIKKNQQDNNKILKKFSKLITTLATRTDSKIIVRPHPTDLISNFDFLKKYKNITVTKQGSISECINHAKIVIHSGSSGGLESSIRGIPTIAYSPFNSSHGHKLADSFSIKASGLNECIKLIQNIMKNKLKLKNYNTKSIKHRAHNIFSKKAGFKIIADEFIKLKTTAKFEKKNNNLALKIKFKLRDLRSKILNYKYGNIKFSTFEKDDTLKVFEILKELNPKYNDLSINFMKKDIIYIKNNNKKKL